MSILRGVTGTVATGTSGLTVTIPATATVGHFMVMTVASREANMLVTSASASGWVQLATATDTSGITNSPSITILYRVCQAGDLGANVVLSFSNTPNQTIGVINTYSGVAASPFNAQAAAFHSTGVSTSHTTATINTTQNQDWVLAAFSDSGGATWTPPAGYTERSDVRITGATLSLETVDSNGPILTTGNLSLTATSSGSTDVTVTWIGALLPSPIFAPNATGTSAASPPDAGIARTAGTVTASSIANNPTLHRGELGFSGEAVGTATANDPHSGIKVRAGTATAIAVAQTPVAVNRKFTVAPVVTVMSVVNGPEYLITTHAAGIAEAVAVVPEANEYTPSPERTYTVVSRKVPWQLIGSV